MGGEWKSVRLHGIPQDFPVRVRVDDKEFAIAQGVYRGKWQFSHFEVSLRNFPYYKEVSEA